MIEIETLEKYCYPIDLTVSITELHDSINILLKRLGLSFEYIHDQCNTQFGFTVNLTHLPHLTGHDRWRKYSGNHLAVLKGGVKEGDFTTHLEESQDLLIGKLIHEIYAHHSGKFQGRAQLVWLSPKKSYNFHTDAHTPNRYHVPIATSSECYWLFRDSSSQTYKLHMPADGRIWYLDPIGVQHTFCNMWDQPRLHLLLTSAY